MAKYYKYKIIETYRDGGMWTHYFASELDAVLAMETLKAAHKGRTYELVEVL